MSARVRCSFCGARVPAAEKCVRCRASLTDRSSGSRAAWIVVLVLLVILLPTVTVAVVGVGFWQFKLARVENGPRRHADDDENLNPQPGWPAPIAIAPAPPEPPGGAPRVNPNDRVAVPVDWKLPPTPARLPIKPTTLTERTTYRLPDVTDRVIPAGGGRYLVLHFSKLRKVGVFDVNESKIVRYIDLAENRPQLAAGMTKLVAYLPSSKLLQRYDLFTGEREAMKELPGIDVKAMAMGHASAGPLAIAAHDGGRLVNVETLAEMTLPTDDRLDPFAPQGPRRLPFRQRLWSAANGRVFISTGDHNGATVTLDRGLTVQTTHGDAFHYARPNFDGKYVFRDGCGAVTLDNQKTADAFFSDPSRGSQFGYYCLPAAHGPYYFHIHFGHQPQGIIPKEHEGFSRTITVYTYALDRKVIETDASDVPDWGNLHEQNMPVDERLHLIPQARLFVSVNQTRDCLTLVPLDLDKAIDSIAAEFVLVTSIAPATFCPGHEFRYAIQARSKEGKLKYLIESGPAGMKVDAMGVVTWNPPAAITDDEVSVIVSIRDIAGKEAFHTFKLSKSNMPEQP